MNSEVYLHNHVCRRAKKKSKEEGDEDTLLSSGPEENLNILPAASGYPPETIHSMSQINERDINMELLIQLLTHIKKKQLKGAVLIFLPGWNVIFIVLKYLQMHPVFGI